MAEAPVVWASRAILAPMVTAPGSSPMQRRTLLDILDDAINLEEDFAQRKKNEDRMHPAPAPATGGGSKQ